VLSFSGIERNPRFEVAHGDPLANVPRLPRQTHGVDDPEHRKPQTGNPIAWIATAGDLITQHMQADAATDPPIAAVMLSSAL